MTQSFIILGRQPALGLAELESIYGSKVLTPIGKDGVVVDVSPDHIDFDRLGGSVKLAKLLSVLETTNWGKIESYLANNLPKHIKHLPEGKLVLGLSAYNLGVQPSRINASALTLKKIIKGMDRPCRIVPNKEPALSSAQVLHNKLFGSHSWELMLIGDGDKTYLAQTGAVQDITAYAARDQKRPKRDSRVGMLPPKLAQIIINLAVGPRIQKAVSANTNGSLVPTPDTLNGILDPFCGTGVILQEALLMGSNVVGSDREPRMVDYTKENLDWIRSKYNLKSSSSVLEADATEHTWTIPFYSIATETYLGRPFSSLPAPDVIQQVVQDVDTIHKKFLRNVARQTKSGFTMCIAVPAWKTKSGFKHLPTLDHLEELGYTRAVFVHAHNQDLIYHRPEQIVGRELAVLIRK